MPRYLIDTDDGDFELRDAEGGDYVDDAAARLASLRALWEMVRDMAPDGDRRIFCVRVSRLDRSLVYSAKLTFEGRMANAGR